MRRLKDTGIYAPNPASRTVEQKGRVCCICRDPKQKIKFGDKCNDCLDELGRQIRGEIKVEERNYGS